MKLKQKQLSETNKKQDIDEELALVRTEHVKLIGKQGEMLAREKVDRSRSADYRIVLTTNETGARSTDCGS